MEHLEKYKEAINSYEKAKSKIHGIGRGLKLSSSLSTENLLANLCAKLDILHMRTELMDMLRYCESLTHYFNTRDFVRLGAYKPSQGKEFAEYLDLYLGKALGDFKIQQSKKEAKAKEPVNYITLDIYQKLYALIISAARRLGFSKQTMNLAFDKLLHRVLVESVSENFMRKLYPKALEIAKYRNRHNLDASKIKELQSYLKAVKSGINPNLVTVTKSKRRRTRTHGRSESTATNPNPS